MTATTSANGLAKHNVIAIDDQEMDKRACGRITFWDLSGDVDLDRLTQAVGNIVKLPESPTPKVCVHRAVDECARRHNLEVRHRGAAMWDIVGTPVEENRQLVYPIETSARLMTKADGIGEEVGVSATGQYSSEVLADYSKARGVLATTDIGNWLCDTLTKLGGIPLRDRGGVYFVPQDRVEAWERVVAAIKACSMHKVHVIPAMRSQDAVEAILAAITADTRKACETIVEEIGDGELGKRALETRENQTADLLDRLDRYEGLLGTKLDELRAAIDETRQAVAVARLMNNQQDAS
jgi:hypothetical protein